MPRHASLGMMSGLIRHQMMSPQPSKERLHVLAEIRTFVANWFRDGKEEGLDDDTPLVTSGILDSAGVLEVVEFLEKRFRVTVHDLDVSLANCNTLRGLTALVESRIST